MRVDRLDPGPYLLKVDGDIELLLDVSADGSSEMRLREPMKSGSGMMNIWPEGKTIRLLDASGAAVLEAQMPYDYDETAKLPLGTQGFHSLDDGAIDGLQVDFIKVAELDYPAPQAGWLAWQIDASAVTSVTVKLTGQDTIPPEPYGIYVGDEWIGEVGDYPGGYVDPFESTLVVEAAVDPRGQRLEVRQGDAAGLSLVFPQSVPAAVRSYRRDVRKPNRLRLDLLNPGTDLDATGFLDWRRAKSGAERLLLVVRDLPAGAYDVVLDGEVVSVGALVVAEDGGTAKQQFSNSGKPASALPLDFEVQGQLEVRASGQAITFLQQDLHD